MALKSPSGGGADFRRSAGCAEETIRIAEESGRRLRQLAGCLGRAPAPTLRWLMRAPAPTHACTSPNLRWLMRAQASTRPLPRAPLRDPPADSSAAASTRPLPRLAAAFAPTASGAAVNSAASLASARLGCVSMTRLPAPLSTRHPCAPPRNTPVTM